MLAGDQYIASTDFGTSRSVAAVGQAANLEPHRVQIVAPSSGIELPDHKILTAVALDSKGEVRGFGYNARDEYYRNPHELRLFEGYKMALKDLGKAGRRKLINSSSGMPEKLMKVISKTLECFKDEVLAHIESNSGHPVPAHHVKWVLTVPAIWSDRAKIFMREAAYHAGMIPCKSSSNLVLCLEPEGACLSTFKDSGLVDFAVGSTFIVVDAGGGTIDITGHQIESLSPNFQLKSIIVPTGNAWGSTMIDGKFRSFLKKLLGEEVYGRLSKTSFFHADLLANQFEFKKLQFDRQPNNDALLNLSGAISLEILSNDDLRAKVAEYNRAKGAKETDPLVVAPGGGLLTIKPRLMMSMFKPALDQTIQLVQTVLDDMPSECKNILLVGGFGGSRLLQKRMRDAFGPKGITIKVPKNPSMATVRGALYAATMDCMTSRKAKYTYAVQYSEEYNPRNELHRARSHRTYKAKRMRIDHDYVDLLLPMVGRGTDIPVGFLSKRTALWPLLPDQTQIGLAFYGVDADAKDTHYPDAKDHLGTVVVQVDMSRPFIHRGVDIQLEFDTEIRPHVYIHRTQQRIDDKQVSIKMATADDGSSGDLSDSDDDQDELQETEQAELVEEVKRVVLMATTGDSSGCDM